MLTINALSKRYRLYYEKPSMVRSVIPLFLGQGTFRKFWALANVSFSVEPGKCVGLIGANGSGKSTLLKIIAGVTSPTRGNITVDGRISSLLDLGSGFHPELTGRENIYLNGSILGLTKREIDDAFPKIVDFSGLDNFINTKLFAYSSGMVVRLGFAVAIHVPFEVLLIDEIIAVGDPGFQEKCFSFLNGCKKSNKTIIVVSHNMAAIETICDRTIWLEHGKIAAAGETKTIVPHFLAANNKDDKL